MKNIKYHYTPVLKNPVMVACWAGMGNVSLGTADYMRLKLDTRLLAETNISDLVAPEIISVQKGLSSVSPTPNLSVYFTESPPLIISVGKEQFYGKAGIATMERLLEIANKFDVTKIFTCAAFPTNMSHRGSSRVYAVANSRPLLRALKEKYRLLIMEDGQISGLNGLLLEAARKKKIEAACLLATLPAYAVSFPNPKASKALITALQAIFGIDIDMAELDLSVREVDTMLQNIEEQLKHLGVKDHKEEPFTQKQPEESEELPKKVFDKIERMFEEAKKDKRMAHQLKEELDRWNLFRVYEDRFLDLFRESH